MIDLLGFKQKVYSDWGSKGLLRLKQKLYSDWSTKSNQTRKYDLLEHKQKVYSANNVYITMSSGVCQAQTQIQARCVLRINHKCGALGFKHNVYLDSSTMCTQTRIAAQGCNQTRIQAQSVLRLDQQGIQIKD
jgi:hypothetical protein